MFCDAQKYPQNILNFVNTKLFAPPKERVVHCFLLNLIVKIVIKCISNVNREMEKKRKIFVFFDKKNPYTIVYGFLVLVKGFEPPTY